jgi:hypothetical protein
MSLIKKSDVKNHLSARYQNRIHIAPVSQPDATGFSGPSPAPIEPDRSGFNQDFTGDHTTSFADLARRHEVIADARPPAQSGPEPLKP